MIDLGSEQVIEHVHGGGEQHALISLAGAPCHELGQECFAHARISDEHDVGSFGEKGEIEQAQEAWFGLQAALVMVEMKSVDARLGLQARGSETPLNGTLGARFDFHVEEPFQGGRGAEIFGSGVSQSRLQLAAHGGQAQLVQLLFEWSHRVPFQV